MLRPLVLIASGNALMTTLLLVVGGTDPIAHALVVLLTLTSMPVAARFARGLGQSVLAEARAGYTTVPVRVLWWPGLPLRATAWNFDGLWHLAVDGTVLREPDPDVDPVGMAPGPDGRWQLWTGTTWIDHRPPGWSPPW